VAQEGYGIGYGMNEEQLRFNITAYHQVTPFLNKLEESLKEMIAGNTSPSLFLLVFSFFFTLLNLLPFIIILLVLTATPLPSDSASKKKR